MSATPGLSSDYRAVDPAAARTVSVAEALSANRLHGPLVLIVVLASLMLVADGFDNTTLGFTAPAIASHFGVSRAQIGNFISLQLLGVVAGGIVGGLLGDRWGRRGLMIGSVLLFSCGSLLSAVAQSVPLFLVARIGGGVGLGALAPNVAAYLMEVLPDKWRGLLTTLAYASLAIGGTVCGLVARTLQPAEWPTLFFVGGLGPLVVVPLVLLCLPESPRFLVGRGASGARIAAVLNRLTATRRFHRDQTFTRVEVETARARIVELLSPRYRRDTICLWLMIFTLQFVVAAVLNMGTTLLTSAGLSLHQAVDAMTTFTIGGIAGIVSISWAIRVAGSRVALGVFLSLGLVGVGLWTSVGLFRQLDLGMLRLLVGVVGFSTLSVAMASTALAAQVYPTVIRSTGTGSALTLGRIGSIASSTVIGIALLAHGPTFIFGGLLVVLGMTLAATLLLTRHIPAVR